VAEEAVTNNESTPESSDPDVSKNVGPENPNENGGDGKAGVSIRDQLTRRAVQILDESDYEDDEFASMLDMYDKTMKSFELGNIVTGSILKITEDSVIVDIGFKSEGIISIQEFGENTNIQVGDEIEVFLDDFENQEGQMVLSKQKADFMRVWDRIKDI